MPSFAVSIGLLTLVQALIVLLPRPRRLPALERLRSGVWASAPALSIVAFVLVVDAVPAAADFLTYLALAAVPLLAAIALGAGVRGSRAWLAPAAAVLFALAWANRGGLAGEGAAVALEALSCVTLAILLVAVTPVRLVKLGIVATAAVDTWFVASNHLQGPNGALNGVVPPAHLPQLQSAPFGTAVIGYEDLFVAALLGALLAARPVLAWRGAVLAGVIGLAFDLLFLFARELPATVPIALTLLVLEAWPLARVRRPAAV